VRFALCCPLAAALRNPHHFDAGVLVLGDEFYSWRRVGKYTSAQPSVYGDAASRTARCGRTLCRGVVNGCVTPSAVVCLTIKRSKSGMLESGILFIAGYISDVAGEVPS
jgi:hypothetical protein